MKRRLFKVSLLIFALISTLVVCEVVYRWMLFGGHARFANLRSSRLYADRLSDDEFHMLRYLMPGGGQMEQSSPPQPVVGWVSRQLSAETLMHEDAARAVGKRPVLLYGDSFAACVHTETCFETLLNEDEVFAEAHHLLNYGVPGYGVDQILLLFEHSVDAHENPFVVFSLMTLDLDRNLLTFRGQPKPYFRVEGGTLQLRGSPVTMTRPEYIAAHPPAIRSYLYRRLLRADAFPQGLRAWLTAEAARIEVKKEIGEGILRRAVAGLERRGLDYVLLIFHPHLPRTSRLDENDWRDAWLRNLLDELDVPYIWTKDLFRRDASTEPLAFERYILPDNGHPTTYFNELIAAEIKRHVLQGPIRVHPGLTD